MMVRFLTIQILALAMLVAPLFGGNDKNFTYLALGDSIAFGYDPTLFQQPTTPTPDQFVGYPERVAESLHLLQSKKEVNAACPGETSGSFLNVKAPDNGCNSGPNGGFKASIGLHTAYPGIAQGAFAVSELGTNKHINLVTLSIGGNDLLLLQQYCATNPPFAACVTANLPSVLAAYGQNLTAILLEIRAKYHGTLIVMNSYSPSPDPTFLEAIRALNKVTNDVAPYFGVKFADAFTAFQHASKAFGGDPCRAGLLIPLSSSACDVHPSPKGRDLLAETVLSVL